MVISWINSLLDVVFSPLLALKPLYAIALISLLISLLIVLVTKFATDQDKMKSLKDRLKGFQKEMRKKQKEQDMAGLTKLQKEMMGVNFEYMKHSFRTSLYTMIPVLLIFWWLTGQYAFAPITSQDPFEVTLSFTDPTENMVSIEVPQGITVEQSTENIEDAKASFLLTAERSGTYDLAFMLGEQRLSKQVIVSDVPKRQEWEKSYEQVSIILPKNKLIVFNFLGWKWGWFITYIFTSILFTVLLRKWMKVY